MRRARPFIAGVTLTVLVWAAVAIVQHRRAERPDVGKVAAAALARDSTARGLPPGFPDFSARGWRAEGSRSDELGGRTVVTVAYRRGGQLVTFSRMADTRGLNDAGGSIVRTRPVAGGPDVSLDWQAGAPELAVRFVRFGHQTVLAARPATAALQRELGNLAVASVRPAA